MRTRRRCCVACSSTGGTTPLEAGALLAAAVDTNAAAVRRRLLEDGRDELADAARMLDRAAMLQAMGGLVIGGRTRVLAAAALASWTASPPVERKHSPALSALGGWLGGGSEGDFDTDGDPPPPAPPSTTTVAVGDIGDSAPRLPPPARRAQPAAASAATRRGVSGVGSHTACPALGISANPRGRRRPRVAAHAATTGCAALAVAGFPFAGGRQMLETPRSDPRASPTSAATPAAAEHRPRPPPATTARLPSLAPAPLSSDDRLANSAGGASGATPVVRLEDNDEPSSLPLNHTPSPRPRHPPPPPPPPRARGRRRRRRSSYATPSSACETPWRLLLSLPTRGRCGCRRRGSATPPPALPAPAAGWRTCCRANCPPPPPVFAAAPR